MSYKEKPWTLTEKKSKKNVLSKGTKSIETIETNSSLSRIVGINHQTLQKVMDELVAKKLVEVVPLDKWKATQGYVVNPKVIQIVKQAIIERKARRRTVGDLTGQVFGRLTVVKKLKGDGSSALYLCRCTCGNTKKVLAGHLRAGNVRSCGCLKRERIKNYFKKKEDKKTVKEVTRLYREQTTSKNNTKRERKSKKKSFTLKLFGWKIKFSR